MNSILKLILLGLLLLIVLFTGYSNRHYLLKFYLGVISDDCVFQIDTNNLLYRLYVPKNKNGKIPLVLYLHGGAQKGLDNKKQLDYVFYKFTSHKIQKKYPCFVLAPQYPLKTNWINHTKKHIPFDHYQQDSLEETIEMKMVVELIKDVTNKYPIDTTRIYATGFSMGATAVWDLITRHPDIWAAAIPMSGESDTSKAYKLTNIAIWAHHGKLDNIVPYKINQEMIDCIKPFNPNAKLSIYSDIGHGCQKETLKTIEVFDWLFSQKK